MSQKLIRNGLIVTMDSELGDIHNGSILVDGENIAEVGRDLQAPDGCEVIDAAGMIVIPGLVDMHKHLWQTALRAVVGDLTLVDYFHGVRRNYLSRYRPEDVRIGTYVGALELLHSGTTTVLDHSHGVVTPDHADALAEAELAAGVRGVWAYGYCPVETQDGSQAFGSHADRISDAFRVREQYFSSDGSLLSMGIAMTEQGLLPLELTEDELRSAQEMDAVWTTHCHCGPGNAPITRGFHTLYAKGFIDQRAVLSHCNEFGVDDFAVVAETGAHFASSPDSEIALGIARPTPYMYALLAGVQPSLGTDCVTCMSTDMFACMRMALTFARHQFNSGPGHTFETVTQQAVSTRDVFRWATIEGAKALGLEHRIGTLTPGKAADIVLVDATAINLAPVLDPVADLVLHAHAGNVDTVLVNGTVRKRGGTLVDVDLAKLLSELSASRDYLVGDADVSDAFAESKDDLTTEAAEWSDRVTRVSAVSASETDSAS
jgi:cytosine/adenosine deaminase-related metal-dependent hydrolase